MRFVINPSGNPAASSDRWLIRPDFDGVAGSCVWQQLGGNEMLSASSRTWNSMDQVVGRGMPM